MKPKKDKDKEKVHKLIVGKQREKQISQGFFDGRFVERTEESKKVYTRSVKHKKEDEDDV
jgi:hypothetical protein